jgi:hypothetical protein
LAATALIGIGWAGTAAAVTDLTLNQGNADIAGAPGPYGTVDINLTDPTHATITFKSDNVGANDFFFIDSGIADVNVNAASWTIGNFVTNANSNGLPFESGGSGTVDGFGVFNQTTNQHDGFGSAATQVSFVVTDTGGTWSSSDNVLTPNGDGFEVGAHVAVCPDPCPAGSTTNVTGFAVNGAVVPEPATWALMITGVGAIGAALRMRRKNSLTGATA